MPKIRVTKEFHFEMAHALWNYNGLCRNVHGHSYKLFVTIIGEPEKNQNSPKQGMVMDFGDLKKIVNEKIVKVYDHSLVINSQSTSSFLNNKEQLFERHFVFDFQPTCENLCIFFAELIKKEIPSNITLHSVKLSETESSFTEWFAEDNDY